MRSSRTITLFTERQEVSQWPSSFLFSILMHGTVIGLVTVGVLYGPQKNSRVLTEPYPVRRLDLHIPDLQRRASAAGKVAYPGPHSTAGTPAPEGQQNEPQAAMRLVAKAAPGAQTLVQPDIHAKVTLAEEVPVPTAVIWTPQKIVVKTIVPPKPQAPTAAEVQPSLDPPNEEVNLADLGISASDLASTKQVILPSTTSPVVVHGPEKAQITPATTSESQAQPTPAAVVSLSDLHMAEGSAALPPVNETVAKASPGALAPGKGQAKNTAAQTEKGNPVAKADGKGAGRGSTDKGAKSSKPDPSAAAGNRSSAKSEPVQGAETGSGTGAVGRPKYDVIKLPRDGEFGAVVVGSSMEEKYPETAELWSGRMTYSAYVHVGLARSWILQYSLSREGEAAAGGNITHIEAPWPYNIVRPNIAPGSIDADALMVHGFVNEAGRFEQLTVAFPPQFAQAGFVLDALARWEFRPATQGGRNVRVEVLLVIPEIPE